MRCADFEVRLNEVLDERQPISSAADLNEHIRECRECRYLARSYEAIFAGLREAVIPEPEWVSRLVLEQVQPRFGRLPLRRAATLLALAATMLLAVGLSWLARPNRPVASSRLKTINIPLDQVPGPAKIDERAVVSNGGSAADKQAPSNEFMELLPSSQWAQDVAEGLQPVTQPTVGTINDFLQLWGVGDEGHRS